MTPKPFGSYSESEWYLHMLIRGKDKNINYQPMSFFRTKMSKQRLEEYMGDGKIISKVVEEAEVKEETPTITETGHNLVLANVIEGFIDHVTNEIEIPIIADEILNLTEESPVNEDVIKDEIPEPPQISSELQEERKQEFLGLSEEEKTEEKKDENKGEE